MTDAGETPAQYFNRVNAAQLVADPVPFPANLAALTALPLTQLRFFALFYNDARFKAQAPVTKARDSLAAIICHEY